MAREDMLRWENDPTVELVDGFRIDPYSHWMLAYGRSFDFNTLESVEDDNDFSFLAVLDEAEISTRIKAASVLGSLTPLQIEASVPRTSQIAALAEKIAHFGDPDDAGTSRRHVFRLPLRRRAVGEQPSAGPNDAPPALTINQPDFTASPAPDVTGERLVITAVIDDHVNIVHRRFCAKDETRVDFAWFQDGARHGGVPFGRELTRAEIDDVLNNLDETPTDDARLRRLGLIDFSRPNHNPLALRASHGTHVLDIAAGAPPDQAGIGDWRIITVSLPSLVTFETSGAFLDFFFVIGLQYILQRARELSIAAGKPGSLVINCSYGIAGGPHDGTHLIERTIEQLLDQFRSESDDVSENSPGDLTVDLVLPAGNGNLDRGCASAAADEPAPGPHDAPGTGQRQKVALNLPLRIQPGDLTSSYLEIWLPKDAGNREMHVTCPGGLQQQVNPWNKAELLCPGTIDGLPLQPVARVDHGLGPDGRERIVLAIAPTKLIDGLGPSASSSGAKRTAPAGLWRIHVSADILPDERIDARIRRDASPIGSRVQGRQAYFDDPAYHRFDTRGRPRAADPEKSDSMVRRTGTLNGVATGRSPYVVAGFSRDRHGQAAAHYSGTGTHEGRTPDLAAVSDHSLVLPGVLAAGTNSGSRVAINGTSVAAPAVARLIAERAVAGPPPTGPDRSTELLAQVRDKPSVSAPDDPAQRARVGAGWLGWTQVRR